MAFAAVLESNEDLIPQANDPERIVAATAAVAAGCARTDEIAEAIGVHARQGAYYANAALRLGLVDRIAGDEGHTWSASTLGNELAEAAPARQAAVLTAVLASDDLVASVLSDDTDERELVRLACEEAGLTGKTVERRISTVRTWGDFVTQANGTQAQLVERVTAGVAARAEQVIEQRMVREAEAAAKAAAAERQTCGSCHMQLPFSGVCDFC